MNVFLTVARRGSFTAASSALGISRAMVSKQVKGLEDHLGVRLFDRNTRAVSLTEAGRHYLERCQQVLDDLDELENSVKSHDSAPQGTLRVWAPPSFGTFHLTPAVAAYMDAHPRVVVELILSDRRVDLIEEGLDLAVAVGRLDDSSLVARPLTSVQLATCASPSYLGTHGTPQTPKELVKYNCLVLSPDMSRQEWLFHGPGGEVSVRVSGDLRSNMSDALRVAAIHGRGIVRLPSYMVSKDIGARRLASVLDDYPSDPTPIHCVYPHRRHLSRKVQTFVEFLKEWFAPEADVRSSFEDANISAPLVKYS
jgi:DNA-binding transcriptional LysR family regulator